MPDDRIDHILRELKQSGRPALELLNAYRQPEFKELWSGDPRLYRVFGKRLISADHPSRAFEIIRAGLEEYENDPQLCYLRALALARSGNVGRALGFVDELLDRRINKPLRVETLSLKGRLYKDRFRRTGNAALKMEYARESAGHYRRAWKLTDDSFPAINAATMSLLCGRRRAARDLARTVVELVQAEQKTPGRATDYWLVATLGEAHLLLEEDEPALECYGEAVELAAGNDGDIASMRLQLKLLEDALPQARAIDEVVFDLGRVVVFAGHMLDQPDRPSPRFPNHPKMIQAVRREIRARLEKLNARVGYSSVACGADILFCEELLKRKESSLHVILPFRREDFYQASVDFGMQSRAEWRQRCDSIIDRAVEVHYATRGPFLYDDLLFEYGNTFSQGLSVLRAQRVGTEPVALCVLDPQSKGTVGTAAFCSRWEHSERAIDVIDLSEVRAQVAPPSPSHSMVTDGTSPAPPRRRIRRKLHAMLFADVKNYSKLSDERAPDFMVKFIDRVSRVVNRGRVRPTFQNTWGDGLFFVFETVSDCATIALALLERIEATDWTKIGLPADTTIRVAVHAGPVYRRRDRIIDRDNFFGDHVNRTARIEPVTTPGCVFASEQFAAELAVSTGHDFVTEYVGVEELAKGYDRCALYQLTRCR